MLKELLIKNFMSFNEEVLFSMAADINRVTEFEKHIVEINDDKILKVASLYGPNGGGKSNLIKALKLCKYVQDKTSYDANFSSCIFSNSNNIEETIFFITDKYEIGYKFVIQIIDDINEENAPDIRFISEDISYRECGSTDYNELLSRNEDGIVTGDKFISLFENKTFKLSVNMSIVKYTYDLYANNDSEIQLEFDVIRELMKEIKKIENINFSINKKNSYNLIQEYSPKLVKLLNDIDINVKDIIIDNNNYIYFIREIVKEGKKVKKQFRLEQESDGTIKAFNLFINLLYNMDNGMIYYCDDFNNYLHPKLVNAFVNILQEQKSKSQFIFNSHDIVNMTNELFRRDEIWLCYKDDNYSTKLIPLSNIVNYNGKPIRKDAKYYKQYLEGRYGGDPFIKKGLNW